MTDRAALQQRTLRVLLASQVLSGVGLAAGVTVGALLAEDVLGTTALSGLPAALMTGGAAALRLGGRECVEPARPPAGTRCRLCRRPRSAEAWSPSLR